MLKTNKYPGEVATPAPGLGIPEEFYSSFLVFVRRQWPVVLFVTLLTVALGLVYALNAPASYTAQATMIIDTHKINILQQQSLVGDLPVDSATVESQVEILRSENIALAVIKQLHLANDPEFVGSGGGLIGNVLSLVVDWLGGSDRASDYDRQRRAATTFAKSLTIKRLSLTYIIEIGFKAGSPQRSAEIANAVANAYIVDQLEAKYNATQRASVWLQERLRELRDQLSAAERAVVDFKNKNNIVASNGKLMNEQQVSDLNSQLVLVQAQTAEARARLDRIQQILNQEVPDATVTDTLRNDVIIKLRQQYLELKQRESDWSTRYGKDHLAAVQLRNQMFQIRRSILDELGRIAETYKSDFEIAKQREAALRTGLSQAVSQSQITNQAQVTLGELESTAASYKRLYDNFLQRYMESVQQQTFPITEARIITAATAPLTKSNPKTFLILFISAFAGFGLGLGAARLRDMSDRVFRTTDQVENILDATCIGLIPALSSEPKKAPIVGKAVPVRLAGERIIKRNNECYWQAVDEPFSRFAEAIRAIKVSADVRGAANANKVLGITSSLPNEGKSTVAASTALVMAQGGAKVLLIDADLRNPSLTRKLAVGSTNGIVEVMAGTVPLSEALWKDPASGLNFLPAVLKQRIAHTHEILGSQITKDLFQKLRSYFDYIIVDLSPLAPVVDVRTVTNLVDSFVFVVEWGKTKIDVVQHALRDAPGVYENLLGVALNKTDLGLIGRYESYRGTYYYNKYYGRYGYTD